MGTLIQRDYLLGILIDDEDVEYIYSYYFYCFRGRYLGISDRFLLMPTCCSVLLATRHLRYMPDPIRGKSKTLKKSNTEGEYRLSKILGFR